MSAIGLMLIPYDGGREALLNASEAKSQRVIEDPIREARLSELLDQRGMDVKFMFTDRGVLMHGTKSEALTIGRLVHDLPSLTPARAIAANTPYFSEAANDAHIAPVFEQASRRFNVAPIRGVFAAAAKDEPKTVIWGRRVAIHGSHRTLAA